MENSVGAVWLASVLAPWTVSPHPNFSQKSISATGLLALVTERRFLNERERYGADFALSARTWEVELVDAASQSLDAPTQQSATATLWTLSISQDLPAGARVAAALYASVGSAELEMSSDAERRLAALVSELSDRRDPEDCEPSLRLVVAALLQHRVARLYDSCRGEAALEVAADVLRWVPRTSDRKYEDFPVSQGISWGAPRVQADIASSLKQHALEARSMLEGFRGQSWVRVVRARKTWIDMRLNNLSAERDSSVLRDAYEQKIESNSGARHFMRRSTVEAGYEALQLRELAGQIGLTLAARESLGKILMLDTGVNEHRTREAIRLLRQANAQSALKSTLAWVRNQGPVNALRTDAAAVIARVELDGWITESDLLVLESAGDFLSSTDRARALRASFAGLTTRARGMRSSWATHDRVWKTIAALISGTDESRFVVGQLSQYLRGRLWRSRPVSDTLARVVDAVDWSVIGAEGRTSLQEWVDANSAETEEFLELWRALTLALSNQSRGVPEELSLARAAYLADNGKPPAMLQSEVIEVADYVVRSVSAEADQARLGSFSYGGYSTTNVAVAFAIRFAHSGVWQAVLEHLIDSDIDASLKTAALDRIARFKGDVPPWFATAIGDAADSLLRSERKDLLFAARPLPVFAEAIRALGALGQLSPETMIDAVMRLAAGDSEARVEAAKTIGFALGDENAEWGHTLLLQLSYDANPIVRAEAGAGLVVTSLHETRLTRLNRDRVRALFEEEGIRTAAMLLTAIRRLLHDGVDARMLDYLHAEVRRLSEPGSPRLVREIAAETLATMTELQAG
ncbi:hypothetical protein [Plantibacter sp. ME-Dv--P-095]|uniref:hypothetical protein n=1 Tax=Plantibacter sp. ME-Dv--P-095 TaxID=3040299 RepID=UPI00254F22B7|nr:hypothetical protein [Plantibacter sp. ME-Dv--P-095]